LNFSPPFIFICVDGQSFSFHSPSASHGTASSDSYFCTAPPTSTPTHTPHSALLLTGHPT
jgi:hypothetical protein